MDVLSLIRTLQDPICTEADETAQIVAYVTAFHENNMTEAEQVRAMILRVNEIAEKLNGNSIYNLPLIMDSSASGGLSPFWADFVDYQPSNIKLETAAHTNTVTGVGTLMWKFQTTSGKTVFLPQVGYHMPKASVCLFSPQSYFQHFGGHGYFC